MMDENHIIIGGLEEVIEDTLKSRRYHEIYEKEKKIKIIPFGDIHYGATECNVKRAMETIRWVKEHPNTKLILMGDLINCGTKLSIGAGTFDEVRSGQLQYDDMTEMLDPVKHQIYGSLIGNHEMRIYKETGYNLTKMLAKQLHHRYYGFGAFIKVRVQDQNYTFYATHGSSGATLPYTKIRKVLELSKSMDADIYLYGHVHSLQVHTQQYKQVNLKKKMVETKKRYFILTGHYLNWEDSYAEMKNYAPEKMGSPTITLTGKERHIRVIV